MDAYSVFVQCSRFDICRVLKYIHQASCNQQIVMVPDFYREKIMHLILLPQLNHKHLERKKFPTITKLSFTMLSRTLQLSFT